MEVDYQLEAVVASPSDRFAEVRELTLDVGFALGDVPGPVANR